jgi:hypothetical protein
MIFQALIDCLLPCNPPHKIYYVLDSGIGVLPICDHDPGPSLSLRQAQGDSLSLAEPVIELVAELVEAVEVVEADGIGRNALY